MDIQVRFDDGTTEMVARDTPCVLYGHGPFDHIKPGTPGVLYSTTPANKAQGPTWRQRAWFRRGDDWRVGRMETTDEQIVRLTAERDAAEKRVAECQSRLADETTRANLAERNAMAWEGRAKAAERALTTTDADRVVAMAAAKVRADAAERRAKAWKGSAREFWREAREAWRVFRWLRDAARDACDREMGEGHQYPEGVKVSTLVAHLNTMFEPTSGDLINARARAGAELVEAREALARLKKDDKARPAAEERLARAETAYRKAQAAESARAE